MFPELGGPLPPGPPMVTSLVFLSGYFSGSPVHSKKFAILFHEKRHETHLAGVNFKPGGSHYLSRQLG